MEVQAKPVVLVDKKNATAKKSYSASLTASIASVSMSGVVKVSFNRPLHVWSNASSVLSNREILSFLIVSAPKKG